MVIGRVFRGIGRVAGSIHGTVFRALGRLPLVGGAFKALGNISAKGLGLMGALSPMAMLGLGEYSPFSSFTSGFAQGSIAEQTGVRSMGNGFNQIFGAPVDMAGQNFGLAGNNYGQYGQYGQNQFPGVWGPQPSYGMPFNNFAPQRGCCCCCGYRAF